MSYYDREMLHFMRFMPYQWSVFGINFNLQNVDIKMTNALYCHLHIYTVGRYDLECELIINECIKQCGTQNWTFLNTFCHLNNIAPGCWDFHHSLKHHGISNHWHSNCLLNSLFKLTSKLHITGPFLVESTDDQWILPIQVTVTFSYISHELRNFHQKLTHWPMGIWMKF